MPKSISERIAYVKDRFGSAFPEPGGGSLQFISSPGRIEILGNHTDHQHGLVITSAVNLDKLGAVRKNSKNEIRLCTEGYPPNKIDLAGIKVIETEYNSSEALIRGVVHGFQLRGYEVGGFDAYLISDVLNGSGLSSSASFEVWVAAAINTLFCGGEVAPVEIAKICQYAENVFFGKPSGLQDQLACAVGGILFIDFEDTENPQIEKFDADFSGYDICIIDSGGDHANLTDQYAAIPEELGEISGYFGKQWLREVDKEAVLKAVPALRKNFGDRAVLRALHIFAENERVLTAREALSKNKVDAFLQMVKASGRSSFMYLQNVSIAGEVKDQPLAIVLALCEELLGGEGAYRIQGGGFAGTVEVFVTKNRIADFITDVEQAIGKGCCHVLSIRTNGAMLIS
ncbi:galactokinase [Clostridia bacterium]|nr:galactokinase [Clostridia bacterium]